MSDQVCEAIDVFKVCWTGAGLSNKCVIQCIYVCLKKNKKHFKSIQHSDLVSVLVDTKSEISKSVLDVKKHNHLIQITQWDFFLLS